MDQFIHLHRHSEYSLLDGVGTATQYVDVAKKLGQPALALTDHGNVSGAIEHVEACNRGGVIPIIGMEAYFKDDRLLKNKENRRAFHSTLLANNYQGFRNLIRLSSESHLTGFYYKPCSDWQLFEQYSDGLTVTTGCVSGIIPQAILREDSAAVDSYCDRLESIFKGRILAEVMPHDLDDIKVVNREIIKIANQRGWPIVATVDAHYPEKEWVETHDIVMMMNQGTTKKKRDADETAYRFDIDSLYLTSREEVKSLFLSNHPDISSTDIDSFCDNTVNFLDNWSPYFISKQRKLPKIHSVNDVDDAVYSWCIDGLSMHGKSDNEVYLKRLNFEFNVLKEKKVVDYFYLVGELVRWAKSNGIRVGLGRGSAAGSLVSYLIGITGIDPIAYGLLFERFLNPSRSGMPDIDIDFQHNRREEAKRHLSDMYGDDHVVDIASFQTFKSKSAVKDTCRVLDVPFSTSTFITKRMTELGVDSVKDIDGFDDDLKKFFIDNRAVFETSYRLEGAVKSQSKHPAGVVVTDQPLAEYIPVMRGKNKDIVTQWSERIGLNSVTEYGFLKVDILGTDSLTRQQLIIDLVKEHTGESINIDHLPVFSDPKAVDEEVMSAFSRGDTFGVFQFQSHGMTELIRQIKPTSLDDISAANALYRPGPLKSGAAFDYGKIKNGQKEADYWHDSLIPFMSNTYGLLVYQEQVMKVVEHLGGLSLAEADNFRKAISKWTGEKGATYLAQYKEKFVDGSCKNGLDVELSESIWEKLVQFASYAFNASHAAGYALQAYQDMFLKVKYPVYFYAANLELEPEHVAVCIKEARRKNLSVLPPDINISQGSFSVDGSAIRFGLGAIKFVGVNAVKEIIDERNSNGKFLSYDDFCNRVSGRKCNKRVKGSLYNSGCFDSLGERLDLDDKERCEHELELIGINLSFDPFTDDVVSLLDELNSSMDFIERSSENETIVFGGEVTGFKEIKTKHGDLMARASLSYAGSTIGVVIFPDLYDKFGGLFVDGSIVMVKGNKGNRGGIIVRYAGKVEDMIGQSSGS